MIQTVLPEYYQISLLKNDGGTSMLSLQPSWSLQRLCLKKRGTFCTSCLPSRLGSCDNGGTTTPSSHGPLSPHVALDTSSLSSEHREMLALSQTSSRDPVAGSCTGSRFTCATCDHRYYTEGIGNGSRAAIHCIILASGSQCSINQHLSDHVKGTFRKAKIFV